MEEERGGVGLFQSLGSSGGKKQGKEEAQQLDAGSGGEANPCGKGVGIGLCFSLFSLWKSRGFEGGKHQNNEEFSTPSLKTPNPEGFVIPAPGPGLFPFSRCFSLAFS